MRWGSRRCCSCGTTLRRRARRRRARRVIRHMTTKGAARMLLAVPLLIGLLWGLGRGGQVAALERITVRYPWLLVLAFAPEVVLYTPLANHAAWAITWGPTIYSASLALL